MRTARCSSRPGEVSTQSPPPGPGTPRKQTFPGTRHTPGTRSHTPLGPGTPQVQTPPWTRNPPREQTPPWPDPPQLPPWMWAWRPLLWPDPPKLPPLGVGLETCKACWDTTTPPDLLQGMLGYHLQCMLGYQPPVDRILDTRFWKYYLAPDFVCGR